MKHVENCLCFNYGLKYTFCLHWEMKGHGSRVNLVKHEALKIVVYKKSLSGSVTFDMRKSKFQGAS